MNTKAYYFKYPNITSKIASGWMYFCFNLGMPIISCYLLEFILSLVGLNKYLSVQIYMILVFISIAIGLFFAFKYCFSFKGVTMLDSCLEITTQTIGFGKNKPYITINYDEIASVYHATHDIRYDRRKAQKSFIAGDASDYVELTLNGGKQFCFSVENQTEFINEIRERIGK